MRDISPETMPEPLATISRMRLAGAPEDEVAKAVGLARKMVWERVARWNTRNPDRRVPQPHDRTLQTKKARVLTLYADGMSVNDIAAQIGGTNTSVSKILSEARAAGEASARRPEWQTGYEAWHYYSRKGASGSATALGNIGDVLRGMTAEDLEFLLDRRDPKDRSMADMITRIVKEHIHDSRG